MGRLKGSVDLKKRKTRKDKGKKKKKDRIAYRKFEKRQSNKSTLKLYIWDIQPMSRDGFHHWNKNIRPKVNRLVYGRNRWRIDAPVSEIDTKEKIEEFMLEHIGIDGSYLVMGCSGSLRSRHGVKWVKLFSFKITDHSTGLRCKFILDHRLFRYKWFWRD